MIVSRMEKHTINKNHPMYKIADELCFKSKNLYNYANYIARQIFIITGKLKNNEEITLEQEDYLNQMNVEVDKFNEYKINNLNKKKTKDAEKYKNKTLKSIKYFSKDNRVCGYDFLDFICKYSEPFIDLGSQSAQQTLRALDKSWKSFLVSIKDYSRSSNKYLGRPKMPKYKKKNGRYMFGLTNMQSQIKEGYLYFAFNALKPFNDLIKVGFVGKHIQTRIIPQGDNYVLEIVYEKEVKEITEDFQSKNIISIDLGLNNFATISNNIGAKSIVINGKGIKSYNQYWNKQMAKYKSLVKINNNLDWSNRQQRLTTKRNNKMDYFMHKASKTVIDYCLGLGIDTVVIGLNKEWKQNSSMHKIVNQKFVQIPYNSFIEKLKYKCEDKGIKLVVTEESYTSGTSFLDGELPVKENYNKERRVFRGLFKSNKDILINADLNGAYQIMRKVFPNAFVNGIVGVDLHPVVINI
jgi:putative transposase